MRYITGGTPTPREEVVAEVLPAFLLRTHARRVIAETMAVNTASRRVLEKAGLRLVRTFRADWPVRIAGDEYGYVEYAITREEWEEGRDAGE